MDTENAGCKFEASWLDAVDVNLTAVRRRTESLMGRRTVKKQWQAAWLLRAVSCIDLTTLSGDDTSSNVQRLCYKAKQPVRPDLLLTMGLSDIDLTCACVCVYPSRVIDCVKYLQATGASHIPIASVATGFPAGQTPLHTRIEEIKYAVSSGASEVDVVINRYYALTGNWKGIYDEVQSMKKSCGNAHLKTILATGELGSLTNVYKASMVCMMAGSDFIKTSTGKESVNAILPVALVMIRAIREYYHRTGVKVGFKPAGGIRSAKDALMWMTIMKEELGDDWTKPNLFRIGASSLLLDIERQIFHYVTGRYAAIHELPLA